MAENLFKEINNPERMGKVLDRAGASAAASDNLKTWLEEPENEKLVREIWDQAMCLAYIDGEEAAAEWLKERVKNSKHRLPSAAQEFYMIYKRCKENATGGG
jgi:hypothetical protein